MKNKKKIMAIIIFFGTDVLMVVVVLNHGAITILLKRLHSWLTEELGFVLRLPYTIIDR